MSNRNQIMRKMLILGKLHFRRGNHTVKNQRRKRKRGCCEIRTTRGTADEKRNESPLQIGSPECSKSRSFHWSLIYSSNANTTRSFRVFVSCLEPLLLGVFELHNG